MIRNLILLLVLLGIAVSSHAQTPERKFRVEFEGNKIFSSDTLLKKLNFCIAKYSDSENKYNAEQFSYCLQIDVRHFLQSRGYLSAKIDEPKVQENEQSLTVKIPIEEGTLYRLGNVNITGAKVFTSEQLREKLNLKTGDIADGQELRQWLFERVKKLYEDNGYIQSDFELEPTFKPDAEKATEGIADLEIVVDEGLRFTIGRIEFVGNGQTSDRVLRSALLIKEDEIFNQQRLVESIEKLNGLGLFEQIDKDKDVELRTDNESPLLKINIRVKERKPF
jgi:outer membrane protein insertion porin family